jgi:two-component system CheB/CheR fusion protein
MQEDKPEADDVGGQNEGEAFRIIGIGASAGGLESLEELFAQLPAAPAMAFVVIQHLSPDFRSMMGELLSRHSHMPVLVVESGMEVQPNKVYLLPPRKEMTIEGGRLLLADKAPGNTRPIHYSVIPGVGGKENRGQRTAPW